LSVTVNGHTLRPTPRQTRRCQYGEFQAAQG
jgi:hypothetical protein